MPEFLLVIVASRSLKSEYLENATWGNLKNAGF